MTAFGNQDYEILQPRIAVFGIGGAGCNAVNNMIGHTVDFFAANTDAQALVRNLAPNKIQLGISITKGLGAGSNPEIGYRAAEESLEQIEAALHGFHMVFITAGMGGGTGTGAAPVVARASKSKGILTVGVVTRPFHFEGSRRLRIAELGIEELRKNVDTLICIDNQKLFRIIDENTTMISAFAAADEVLKQAVGSISSLISEPGLINVDFADVKAIIEGEGNDAIFSTSEASGPDRATIAAGLAMTNPLLDCGSMQGAKGVLINVIGGPDMTLLEVDAAAQRIKAEADPDANIIFGSSFSQELNGIIRVSVVATGIMNNSIKPAISQPIIVTEKPTILGSKLPQPQVRTSPTKPQFIPPVAAAVQGYDMSVESKSSYVSQPAKNASREEEAEPSIKTAAQGIQQQAQQSFRRNSSSGLFSRLTATLSGNATENNEEAIEEQQKDDLEIPAFLRKKK